MGFNNFAISNKIHPLKKAKNEIRHEIIEKEGWQEGVKIERKASGHEMKQYCGLVSLVRSSVRQQLFLPTKS